ncbi:MAG: NAD-dependent malic enzyme [Verrucomicrobia bacterium]|nr:NAD-dependent malic enzyme [Verrucomicrobiota bacterium]
MSQFRPSVSYSFTVRLCIENRPGRLAEVLKVIAAKRGDPGAVDVVQADRNLKVRDLTVSARDEKHAQAIVQAIKKVKGVTIRNVSDRVFLLHLGGKIRIQNKIPVNTRDALSMAYTPGVARVCTAIAEDKRKARTLTIKQNSVAVVSDGSAVLGLGNIGPEAAMPVMEGKAMLFKEFADIDAYPICLSTQNTEEIISAVKWMSPGFGAVNLEDISAPRCFEIEQRLKDELDIPVFHDDQHGTAVVVLAATLNALKLVGKKPSQIRVLIIGAGAAGVAIARILKSACVRDILCCDREGIISRKRLPDLNTSKAWLARNTNGRNCSGSIEDAASGAHIVIGVSGPGLFSLQALKKMAKDPIVFALSNPTPEIMPEEAASHARIIATGRSDYPNQINNVLAFPGIFRGALDSRAVDINEEMKLAAAYAIAGCIAEDELSEEYIIPSVFNKQVVRRVARAVEAAAHKSGAVKNSRRGSGGKHSVCP